MFQPFSNDLENQVCDLNENYHWIKISLGNQMCGQNMVYPLVNVYITMEKHHVLSVNQLSMGHIQ